jgi:hypothetical protein
VQLFCVLDNQIRRHRFEVAIELILAAGVQVDDVRAGLNIEPLAGEHVASRLLPERSAESATGAADTVEQVLSVSRDVRRPATTRMS